MPFAVISPARLVLAAVFAFSLAPGTAGVTLKPESVAGWRRYVVASEARMAGEVTAGERFLVLDYLPDAQARRRHLRAGAILVDRMEATGDDINVPSAMVHHWRGAVFIPGATVDGMLTTLRASAPGTAQEDVLESRVLERSEDRLRLFLRLQRRKFVTVVYNTEHDVRFQRGGPGRGLMASTATRIAEVRNYGEPDERELAPGHDRGFLWRLNAYWRYDDVPGGVIAECESLTLSRDIPAVFRLLVNPMIRSAARESMERTLQAVKRRFARP